MKFTAKRQDLLKSASFAATGTKGKTTMAVLSHLLFQPGEYLMHITGTDLELSITHACVADISDPEPFCIPANLIVDLLGASTAESVSIETRGGKAHIAVDMGNSKMSMMLASEFPALPTVDGPSFKMPSELIHTAFSKVFFAALKNSSGVEWGTKIGMHFIFEIGSIFLTCTDARRVASISFPCAGSGEFILPPNLVQSVMNYAKDSESECEIKFSDRAAMFSFDGCIIIGKLLEANFPNWKQAVPNSFEHCCITNRELLISAIKRASIFDHEKFSGLVFDFGQDLSISTMNPENSYEETISAIYPTPCEPMKKRMNMRYLLDAIERIEGDQVSIEFNESGPVMVQEGNFMCLTMPQIL